MHTSDINIFFAPVSSGNLFLNFEKTVINGIEQDLIERKFQQYFLGVNSVVQLWGIRDAKKAIYNKTKIGDYIFFYKEGVIIGYSKVHSLFQSEELAQNLWGCFQNKQRGEVYYWSNIIVCEGYKFCNIPFSEFNTIAGYDKKFSVRGYLQYRPEATNKIIESFGNIENYLDEKLKCNPK